MTAIPYKILNRFRKKHARLSKLLREAITRDINKLDTVRLVGKILNDLFGYDKFTDVTREFEIDGSFLDFAVQEETPNRFLVEVKTFRSHIDQEDIKRFVNNALERDFKWVVVTNGIRWKMYEICPHERIKRRLRLSFNFLTLSLGDEDDQQRLFLLSKEGMNKDNILEFSEYRKVASNFRINMNTQDEFFFNEIGRNFKYTLPKIQVENDTLFNILTKRLNRRHYASRSSRREPVRKMIKDPTLN